MKKELIDKAWACLPREFREEVKRLYREFTFTREGYYAELFGKHNLTSDTEGEEMLTVLRSQVQEMFGLASTTYNSIYTEGLPKYASEMDIALGKMQAFDTLFGSACLPDEEVVAGNATTTQKKDEPKFKVGDIVRFKYCCTPHRIDGFKMSDDAILYQVGEVWAEESDLEPYTESKQVEPTLFNIESKDAAILHYALLQLEKSAKAVREALNKIAEK